MVWGKSSSLLIVALILTIASMTHAQQDPRAEEAFQEGIAAFELQDWERARARLLEARRYSDSWGIVCNLGRAEFEMGLFRDSAENLDLCLEALSGRSDIPNHKGHQKLAKDLFKRAVSRISVLRLAVSPNNSTVSLSVDNRRFSGPLPNQIFVDPGACVVSIRAPGYIGWRELVQLKPNDSFLIDASLVPDSEPIGRTLLTPPHQEKTVTEGREEPQSHSTAKWITVAAVGGASTLAGGTALGFWIASQDSKSEATALKEELLQRGESSCLDPAPENKASCEELSDNAKRADSQMKTARIMGIGFAAGAAATVALALLWKESPVVVEASTTAGQLSFRGAW